MSTNEYEGAWYTIPGTAFAIPGPDVRHAAAADLASDISSAEQKAYASDVLNRYQTILDVYPEVATWGNPHTHD